MIEYDEDEDENIETCPACANHCGFPLGTLGSTMHYRCRACGWTFSAPVEEEGS